MKNWHINWKKLYISWYNIKNEPIDEYPQSNNEVYQNNPKEYWKKIFHLYIGEYGVEWVNAWNTTHLVFEGPDNQLWIGFRNSSHWRKKGHWDFKIWKQHNDHVGCG